MDPIKQNGSVSFSNFTTKTITNEFPVSKQCIKFGLIRHSQNVIIFYPWGTSYWKMIVSLVIFFPFLSIIIVNWYIFLTYEEVWANLMHTNISTVKEKIYINEDFYFLVE